MLFLLMIQFIFTVFFGIWRQKLKPRQHYKNELLNQNYAMASQFRKAKREKEFDLFVSGHYADIDNATKPSEHMMAVARKLKWTKSKLRPKIPLGHQTHRRKRLKKAPTSLTFRPEQDPDPFRGPGDDEIEPLMEDMGEEKEKQQSEK